MDTDKLIWGRKMSGEIIIYQSEDGQTNIKTILEDDTVWLSQKQMTELFQTTKQNISLHIKNCFKEGELSADATVKDFLTVQTEGTRKVERMVDHYSLDVIISVGYRVKSLRGTQFRIWANRILKEHLVSGYTINKQRLLEKQEKISELSSAILLLERTITEKVNNIDDARELIKILSVYSAGLGLLDDYDHENLDITGVTQRPATFISTDEFLKVIEEMRRDFESDVFGKPKDESFESSTRQIYQSFGGQELYPGIEHKAAILLYLVIKNHSFIDGNKRIAAAVFLYFLDKNNMLFSLDNKPLISNEGLAAITLLIAVSKPEEKDIMVNIVISILNRSKYI